MNVKVGSAPAAWGVEAAEDPKQTSWQRFLDEVTEAGYEWIELGPPGYLPTQPATLRRELERRNLKVAGGFLMPRIEDRAAWPEIELSVLAVGERLAELGARHLVLIEQFLAETDPAWVGLCIDTGHRRRPVLRAG